MSKHVQTVGGDQWLDLSRGSVEKPSKSHGLRPKIFPSIWWPLWVSPVEDTPMSWWRWHDLGFPSHGFHKMDICKIWWETMINISNSTFDKRLYMMIFPHLCFPIKYPQSKPKPWPSIGSFQFGPNKNGVHIGGKGWKGIIWKTMRPIEGFPKLCIVVTIGFNFLRLLSEGHGLPGFEETPMTGLNGRSNYNVIWWREIKGE